MKLPARIADLKSLRSQLAEQIARDELERTRRDADEIRARCATLAGFVREAWPILEPRTTYVHGWHIDAITEHLQAVTQGELTRLLINVPPGSSKSLLTSVCWQCFEWGPAALGSLRYLATSFNEGPVKRDTRKARDLILSPWYQALWPEVELTRSGELSFANSQTGTREGIAFGSLTSQRGDRLIIDDPHSTETAESEAERTKTTRKFREGALDRLNDLERSAIVTIMQRLHSQDISGVIESLPELGFTVLRIPMEYEPKHHCVTRIGWSDPRTESGELMAPERFSADAVAKLKVGKGTYAYAGQYQQAPAPRGGGIFKTQWWRYFSPGALPPVKRIVQSWDTAFKAKQQNDYSVCTTWAECETGYYLIDLWKDRVEFPDLKRMVVSLHAKHMPTAILIEDKASGQSLVQEMQRDTVLPILPIRPDNDKVGRANAVTPIIESGRVHLPEGAPWLAELLQSTAGFPNAAHDDDVDSITQALRYLSQGSGKHQFAWA